MRIKKAIPKNSYLKYVKRKHDYTKCHWCNRVIMKKDNYCCRCGKANPEKLISNNTEKEAKGLLTFNLG